MNFIKARTHLLCVPTFTEVHLTQHFMDDNILPKWSFYQNTDVGSTYAQLYSYFCDPVAGIILIQLLTELLIHRIFNRYLEKGDACKHVKISCAFGDFTHFIHGGETLTQCSQAHSAFCRKLCVVLRLYKHGKINAGRTKGRLRLGLTGLIIYNLGLLPKTDILAPFTVNREENVLLRLSSGRYTSFCWLQREPV